MGDAEGSASAGSQITEATSIGVSFGSAPRPPGTLAEFSAREKIGAGRGEGFFLVRDRLTSPSYPGVTPWR